MHLSRALQPSVVVKHTWLSRYASADWDAPTRCVKTCVTWNCHRKRRCITGVASGYTRFQRKSDHRMWREPDDRGATVLLSHQVPVKQLRLPMHTQQASVNAFTLVWTFVTPLFCCTFWLSRTACESSSAVNCAKIVLWRVSFIFCASIVIITIEL